MPDFLKFPKIIILFLLIAFASFLGVLFTPALPEIGPVFGISASEAQWTMSIYLIGYAIGQLPYGPLANRLGRKKAIAIGCIIAFLGSIMAFTATEFWVLCTARFIQAFGAAVGLKIAFTIVGDSLTGTEAMRAIALLSLAFGIIPGIATAIGGYLTVFAGWRGCFLFLSVYVLLLWLSVAIWLPETKHNVDREALNVKKIGYGLWVQFKDPFVTLHACLMGLSTGILYIFATVAPYIAINRLGLAPNQYGLWAVIPALGIFSGALISQKLSSRMSARINILNGILLVLIGSLVLSLCFANGFLNVWTLFLPPYIIYLGNNFIWSNASSKALSKAKDKSNASAVIQFINMTLATLGVFLIEIIPDTLMVLPITLGIALVLMFAVWFKLKNLS